jgi:hypothetical protein
MGGWGERVEREPGLEVHGASPGVAGPVVSGPEVGEGVGAAVGAGDDVVGAVGALAAAEVADVAVLIDDHGQEPGG